MGLIYKELKNIKDNEPARSGRLYAKYILDEAIEAIIDTVTVNCTNEADKLTAQYSGKDSGIQLPWEDVLLFSSKDDGYFVNGLSNRLGKIWFYYKDQQYTLRTVHKDIIDIIPDFQDHYLDDFLSSVARREPMRTLKQASSAKLVAEEVRGFLKVVYDQEHKAAKNEPRRDLIFEPYAIFNDVLDHNLTPVDSECNIRTLGNIKKIYQKFKKACSTEQDFNMSTMADIFVEYCRENHPKLIDAINRKNIDLFSDKMLDESSAYKIQNEDGTTRDVIFDDCLEHVNKVYEYNEEFKNLIDKYTDHTLRHYIQIDNSPVNFNGTSGTGRSI